MSDWWDYLPTLAGELEDAALVLRRLAEAEQSLLMRDQLEEAASEAESARRRVSDVLAMAARVAG